REGVMYAKNPTCCSDIFTASLPLMPDEDPPRFKTLYDLNKHLPVKLYFHNDRPGENSRDTISPVNYMTSFNRYMRMKTSYQKEYSAGPSGDRRDDEDEDLNDFFLGYVEQGVKELEEFFRLLVIELDKGYEIEVTVKGFASPLAKTEYNVHLTNRR